MFHSFLNMQRAWTCLLLAVVVCETVASAQNGSVVWKDQGHAKDDSSSALKMRVIGGETITNAELGGYIVAMYYLEKFSCGGTLIHERIVLSAAHCFKNRFNYSDWLIIGGISSLTDKGVRRRVKDRVISRNFNSETLNSDCAVVLLDEPMVGENIAPVSLCSTDLKPGMPLVVSGWGLTKEYTKQDMYLRTATVPYIEREKCRESYRDTEIILSMNMICAAVLGQKDACIFDSGGPLVYNKEVCGIVSFGIGCAHKRYPGVYTDVKFLKPFIQEDMNRLLNAK